MTREELCKKLSTQWFILPDEIDAIFNDKDFFQPFFRDVLSKRAQAGSVPEQPIDATDSQAIFFLSDWGDTSIIPDLLACLKMDEDDLDLLYSDSLTEDMWIPIAKVGHNSLEKLFEFVTDTTVFIYARLAVVQGVTYMHHFHPDKRMEVIKFIEKLLKQDCFSIDYIAGILCDCADSGLMELKEKAIEFADLMGDDDIDVFPMATSDDIRDAFSINQKKNFIFDDAYDVYSVNKKWKQLDDAWYKEKKGRLVPDWLKEHKQLAEKVKSLLLSLGNENVTKKTENYDEHYQLAIQLRQIITTQDKLNEFESFIDNDAVNWLLDLPFDLARTGKIKEAIEIGKVWSDITEADNFLADRAVILAEAGWKEEAHQQINEVLQRFPEDVWVRIKVGDTHSSLGELEEAERCYKQALGMSEDIYDREGVLERYIPMLREIGRNEDADALEAEEEKRRSRLKVTQQKQKSLSTPVRIKSKIGRNDPCPCGSGKKYKKCCGL